MPHILANSAVRWIGPSVHFVPMPSLHMDNRKFWTAQHVDLKSSRCCIFPSGPEPGSALGYVTTIQCGTLVHDTKDPADPSISSRSFTTLDTVSFPSFMNLHGSVPLRLGAAMAHSRARRSTPSSTSVASNLWIVRRLLTRF